jgi:hypothetical protein
MTQTDVQEIFLQHIIASLQNDITYLESIGYGNAAYCLKEALYQLTVKNKTMKPLPRQDRQTFDYNPELTQLHDALHHLNKAAMIFAALGYALDETETTVIIKRINNIVSD